MGPSSPWTTFFHATRCGKEGDLVSANFCNACSSARVYSLGPGMGVVSPPANTEGALNLVSIFDLGSQVDKPY